MRQFVYEIADHLIANYLEWDLKDKYCVKFTKSMKITPSIELRWGPFCFYPSIFVKKPAGIELTRGESLFLYRTVMEMKQLKSLSIMKKLNGK